MVVVVVGGRTVSVTVAGTDVGAPAPLVLLAPTAMVLEELRVDLLLRCP